MSQPYSISLLNELHAHFPDLLYQPTRFHNVGDVLNYIIGVARRNPYDIGRQDYERHHPVANPPAPPPPSSRAIPPRTSVQRVSDIFNQPSLSGSDQLYQILYGGLETIPASRHGRGIMNNLSSSESILSFFNELSNPVPSASFMESVIVRPTQEQIDSATILTTLNPQSDNCAICQDSMEDGQSVRILNHCIHRFHRECIDTWFQSHVTCPTCRHDIREQS